jgi:aspartate/tyrosine/aromatic aminotransferase
MSFFQSVEQAPEDPILGLPILFAKDPRPQKVNLGIGTYKTADEKPYVLSVVKDVEKQIISENLNKEYLPIDGDPQFVAETLKLTLGDHYPLKGVFAAQTVGGTAALRVGGEFLANFGMKNIFLSEPSWDNHKRVFTKAGLTVSHYPYYDFQKNGLHFSALCDAIRAMPERGVIVLHGCCHNPTGVDPTFEQWQELSDLIKKQKIFPFFDLAYQGLGDGLEEDARAIRYFISQGHELFIASSYAKNFGLYGERVGLFAAVAHTQELAMKVGSQLKQVIRGMYSNPPLQGGRIVSRILSSFDLRKRWEEELANIRLRIHEMRKALYSKLQSQASSVDFSYLEKQKGMFSFSGLHPNQVHELRQEKGIYMLSNGRINVAGLNPKNIDYVVDAVISVLNDV